jgi:hypothetical protein
MRSATEAALSHAGRPEAPRACLERRLRRLRRQRARYAVTIPTCSSNSSAPDPGPGGVITVPAGIDVRVAEPSLDDPGTSFDFDCAAPAIVSA